MKFGQIVKLTKPELVVSNRHEAWLARNSNPEYSMKAIEFGRKALFDQGSPRDRTGTYSASSLNSCVRRQQLTFIGMPQSWDNTKMNSIFHNGTFMHIRWQMAGLTEGWMKAAEVPIGHNHMRLSGTQDGVAYNDYVVELKSINTFGFSSVNTFGPKEGHIEQVGTYVAATGAPGAVILYEDKNTQEYREFTYTRAELPITEIEQRAERLWEMTENQQLAEPLDKCIAGEGMQYQLCQYRDQCLAIRGWEHAEEMKNK